MNSEKQAFVNKIFDPSNFVNSFHSSFRTPEVLQEIINNKSKITSPSIATKVAWFLSEFTSPLYEKEQKMATTNEVYDVIINHCAKYATTAGSVVWLVHRNWKHHSHQRRRKASLLHATINFLFRRRSSEVRHDAGKYSGHLLRSRQHLQLLLQFHRP